jgi:hypothetical protein
VLEVLTQLAQLGPAARPAARANPGSSDSPRAAAPQGGPRHGTIRRDAAARAPEATAIGQAAGTSVRHQGSYPHWLALGIVLITINAAAHATEAPAVG